MPSANNTLSHKQQSELITALQVRFEANPKRHKGIKWDKVLARLEDYPEKLWSIIEMEKTGGEPDVISHNNKTGEVVFCDCSPESPKGRRGVCYDREALEARKGHKQKSNANDMANAMGIEILSEDEYRALQELGTFDTKTSSWIYTPSAIRKLGGALFADNRFEHTFIYHDGADSYYAARGFRGSLNV